MISGWLFLAIGTVISAVDLVIAHFFARSIGRRTDAFPMDGGRQTSPLAGVHMLRLGAVIFFVVFAALAFGLIPTGSIRPIRLHG
jgi:hypothetical protein